MRGNLFGLVLACLATSLGGCADGDGTGSASVYVKDAPTDGFREVHVNFTKVEVHAAGAGGEDGSDDNSTGWRTVFESGGTDVDLLATAGNGSVFLGESELPAGRYTQIRIHVQSAYGVDHEGAQVAIHVTNEEVKVVRSFEVPADREAQIVLDFDLDQSLREQGGPQGGSSWRLAPVVGKASVAVVDDGQSGEDVDEEGEPADVEGA